MGFVGVQRNAFLKFWLLKYDVKLLKYVCPNKQNKMFLKEMLTAWHIYNIVYRTTKQKLSSLEELLWKNNLEETDQNTEPIQLQLPTYIKTSTT